MSCFVACAPDIDFVCNQVSGSQEGGLERPIWVSWLV
jgi:hypothetical protein